MPDPKPRSLVGKLLFRIKGRGAAPVPKGPADPDRALALYTRYRDATLLATQRHLVLDGQLEARRRAIVTELEGDRYDQAQRLLDALDGDLQAEIQAQTRAIQRLKDEFAVLKKQAIEAATAASTSTSPMVAALAKGMNELVGEIEEQVKAKAVIVAAGRLDDLAARIQAVGKQLDKDKAAYEKAAGQLRDALAVLTSPVIAQDVQKIRSVAQVPAQQKADAGDMHAAVVLALSGVKVCGTVAQLLKDYQQALAQAQSTLQTLLGTMFPLDTQRIQADFIDAARQKAAAGERQAAMDLLAKVAAQCAQAKAARDQSPFDATYTTELATDMDTLLKHPQRAALKAEIDALNQRYTRAKANQSQSLGKATSALFSEIYWECKRLSGLADQRGAYATRRDTVVKPLVEALRTDGPPDAVQALTPEIAAVEQQLAKADRQAGKHLYEVAGEALGEARHACARVAQLKQDHTRYAAIRQEVAGLLQGLPDLKGTALEAAVKRLAARLAQATEQAQAQRQFAAAAQALDALKPEVLAAAQWAAAHGEAVNAAKQALPAGTDASAVSAGMDKVRKLLEALEAHAGGAGAKAQITEMDTLLRQAAKDPARDGPALLAKAADRYVAGLQHAVQHERFEQRVQDVVTPAKLSLDASQPAVATLIQRIDEQVEMARQLSLAQDHAQATQRLEGAMALVAQARQLALDSESCAARLAALKATTVPGLTAHAPAEQDPVIGQDIRALNQALVLIDRMLKSRDFEGALKALDQVEADAHKAALKKKVRDGALTPAEMADQCKLLATRPNGQAALDELVDAFKSGQAVDAVLAAMKARFKLEDAQCVQGTGDDPAKVTQELCALYSAMTKVPAKHTRDNTSFKKIVRSDTRGSSYNTADKAIRMGEGHPDMSVEYGVGKAAQLPDVDDDCKPDMAAPPVKYFDWNTWHEVGHAMDDRKRFMAKNGSQAPYGGWARHGGDLLAVAGALAGELATPGITAQAIARYLDNGATPTPQPAGWNKVTAWALAAGNAQSPWDAGAKCNTSAKNGGLQAGGRIYHEAYPGDWYSYLPAARKQGITGYQFRAPGEWFSELYAAFKSGKLKPSHPARAWLDELFAD